MVLFCHQDSWECRAFSPNQIAPQAASPGTCTYRNRPPRCFLLVYKLTGPDSDSKAQVCKQHCFSLFSLTCLILPLALSLWPGAWVLHTPGHLSHPMRPFSSTVATDSSDDLYVNFCVVASAGSTPALRLKVSPGFSLTPVEPS